MGGGSYMRTKPLIGAASLHKNYEMIANDSYSFIYATFSNSIPYRANFIKELFGFDAQVKE